MRYISTRNINENVSASMGIIKGISDDGGLFVPEKFPMIDIQKNQFKVSSYQDIAFEIMKHFFEFDNLREIIRSAYDDKFRHRSIVPVKSFSSNYVMELFHGKTLAFKDIALSILPLLMQASKSQLGIEDDIVILTATSGDTGKAALEGFKNIDGIDIIVFYPENGTSDIQKRHMITQKGKNTFVIGIKGNFDDAQSEVKKIFVDNKASEILGENNARLSSANSINLGRLIPQIVYYFSSYFRLVDNDKIKCGEKINIVVPTGNFGNILAAYYAYKMGLPVNRFICASNENKVLTDFFKTGIYNINREFKITNSPSMDILISSNLERFIFEITDRNDELVKDLMDQLKTEGEFKLPHKYLNKLKQFYGNYCNEEMTLKTINKVYNEYNYLLDTHTAVGYRVNEIYQHNYNDHKKTLIAATASPFKFVKSINSALHINDNNADDFTSLKILSDYTGIEVPKPILTLSNRPILHDKVCCKEKMLESVIGIINKQ